MTRVFIGALLLFFSQGCIVVGGYSSGRGWFFWPGTIGVFIIAAILFLLLKRRS